MFSRRTVRAPDGSRWKVGRRWMTRPAPKLWRRRKNRDAGNGSDWWELPNLRDDPEDFLIAIAMGVAAVVVFGLFVFVILPLLGIALELALLIVLFSSGIFGRVFLRRPWIVEAVNLDAPEQTGAFAVAGWRRSRRVIRTLAAAVSQCGLPAQVPGAQPVAPKPIPAVEPRQPG